MAETIAGISIPDTALTRDITDYIRDREDDLLFHHSRRVFLFGALMGEQRDLEVDLELLYAGAMFHDLGLTNLYSESQLRFEVDGANAARDFLMSGASTTPVPPRSGWALRCTPPLAYLNIWFRRLLSSPLVSKPTY